MATTQPINISVIIPVYNAEQTIGRAIESVLNQTRPVDEIIVINDGSSDGTAEVVRSYGEKVVLIDQENAGASAARNTGVDAASGDWIAFLDGDDEWLPEKLKLQIEHLERNPDLQWTTGNYFRCHCSQGHRHVPDMSAQQISQCETHIETDESFPDYFEAYRFGAKGCTDTKLIRKDLFIKAGLFLPGQKRMNDIDMWHRIGYIQPRIGFVFEPLAVYHLGVADSIVKVNTDWHMIEDFLDRHFELAKKAGMTKTFRPCAAIALNCWMRILMTAGQGAGIRRLIRRYGDLMAPSFRASCYLGSFCPPLWNTKENIKRRIRNRFSEI